MADKNTTTAIETVKASELFLALQGDVTELKENMAEVFGNEGLTIRDMIRLRLPAGGQQFWTVKDIDGDERAEKAIKCVLLTHRQVRVYWQNSFEESGGNKPPDCFSDDALHGVGTPGIECARCEFAKFGSSDKGRSQACQLKRLMFFLLPDQIFPAYVALPPTSQSEGKSYLLGLLSRGLKPYDVITELTLEPAKNEGGISYSKVKFRRAGALSDDDKAKVRSVAGSFISMINAAAIRSSDTVDSDDYSDDDGESVVAGAPNGRGAHNDDTDLDI